jgi:hypothetical protein
MCWPDLIEATLKLTSHRSGAVGLPGADDNQPFSNPFKKSVDGKALTEKGLNSPPAPGGVQGHPPLLESASSKELLEKGMAAGAGFVPGPSVDNPLPRRPQDPRKKQAG